MDSKTKKNQQLWDQMVRNGVPCSRLDQNLTAQKAEAQLNKDGILGDLKNKSVLCLASGGGQQSIGFALLGAKVTVVDFSEEQIKKDQQAAQKHAQKIRMIKSDMRDLSMLTNNTFDIVYQPYSINYIPKIDKLFDEIARVIKPSGVYHLMFHNPFVHGTWKDGCWGSKWDKNELWKCKGYPIWQPYQDGYPIQTDDPNWNFTDQKGEEVKIPSPQEFKHTLSTVINGLITRGFKILQFKEHDNGDYDSEPGTWDHYIACAPPWFYLWAKKQT